LSEEEIPEEYIKEQKIRKGILFLTGIGIGFLIGVVFMLFVYVEVWG